MPNPIEDLGGSPIFEPACVTVTKAASEVRPCRHLVAKKAHLSRDQLVVGCGGVGPNGLRVQRGRGARLMGPRVNVRGVHVKRFVERVER